MGINLLYEITRRGLHAAQAGINTAGQNIANVETEGYTRRRITLTTNDISATGVHVRAPLGDPLGAGVSVGAYERLRDRLVTSASWEAQSAMGSASEEARLLGALEGVFGVGTDGALTNVVRNYWNAWGDVADNPSDLGVRNALLQQSQALAETMGRIGGDLAFLREENQKAIAQSVGKVNDLLTEISELNVGIREARFEGSPNLAAEDRRDLAVKELSSLVPVRVQDNAQGYMLTINGMLGVQDHKAVGLETYKEVLPSGEVRFGARYKGTTDDVGGAPGEDGALGALVRVHNNTINGLFRDLDQFAADIVGQTNTLHRAGFDLTGATNRDFFNPAGVGAATMRLAVADPRHVAAAGSDGALPTPASLGGGDNTQALGIAGLRKSFEDRSVETVSGLGAVLKRVSTQAASAAAVADHLDGIERGSSGVSLDDEMTRLIQFQQAFAASAKVLSTAEEMMDTLLAM